MAKSENERLLGVLSEWIVLDNQFAWAYISRGYTYLALEKYTEAQSDFATALRVDSTLEPVVYAAQGLVLARTGNEKLAMAEFKKAYKANKKYAGTFLFRGMVFKESQNFEYGPVRNLVSASRKW